MKLKALSHYDNDLDTRFGDCILIYDDTNLVIYDCGHEKHKDAVINFLGKHKTINSVSIVVSHNDSDHTDCVCELLEYLYNANISVTIYCHLYLKHKDEIIERLDDGRRTRDSISDALLEEFNNIADIVNKAESLGFDVNEALKDTSVFDLQIVGPTKDEFINVAVQAIDNRMSDNIDGETVMNAASVQLKCTLDDDKVILLCGDASPEYLKDLDTYDIIQLPHHGQLADAEVVFDNIKNTGSKIFLISDNTGSGENSGGSENLLKSDVSKGKRILNTKDGIVDLPESLDYNSGQNVTKSGIYIPSTQKTGGYGYDILQK
ncbi:MAG: hypothetical protein FWH17_11420 [Oscillospiraceae bacterium]|nr:hypothetical protein [Oscillospiraceae bacterium]